jgi:anti-anti-sigma factor
MTSTTESRTPDAFEIEARVWHQLHEDLWMRVRTAPILDRVVVDLRGAFDDRNAAAVAPRFREVIGLGIIALHVDLGAVEAFDIAGARILAVSAAELEARGGRLRALNASGSVERVLHITGLGRLLIASRDTRPSAPAHPAQDAAHDDASTRTG